MKTSEILDKAADVIERNGLAQGGWYAPYREKPTVECRVCAGGAVNLVVIGYPVCGAVDTEAPGLMGAYRVLAHRVQPGLDIADDIDDEHRLDQYIAAIGAWNDAKGRTAEEVVRELRAAAASEREAGR